MKRAYRIAITVIALIAIGLALTLTVLFQEKSTVKYATSFADLQVKILAGSSAERSVLPYSDSDGNYYLFMPSYAADGELCFCNLSSSSRVEVEGVKLKNKDVLPRELMDRGDLSASLFIDGRETESCTLRLMFSQNIDALFFDTESGNMDLIDADKSHRESGRLDIISGAGKTLYSGELQSVNARGNSTFTDEPKKSYRLKLTKDASLVPEAHSCDEWVLLANAIDESAIRTDVVFSAARLFNEDLASKGKWVDVYANGEYRGNYYLCEKPETMYKALKLTDINREYKALNGNFSGEVKYIGNADNTAHGAEAVNPEDITGGYLIERTTACDNPETSSFFITDSGLLYEIQYPRYASLEMAEYLRQYFNEIEAAVFSEDGVNEETGKTIADYLDLNSWAEKYLIDEGFADMDASNRSLFLYKDSDKTDSHIYFGPYWDYDRSIGGYNVFTYIDSPNRVGWGGLYAKELMKRTEVRELVKEKFSDVVKPYMEFAASGVIYSDYTLIKKSLSLDEIRWKDSHGYYTDAESNVKWVKSFVEDRALFLDNYFYGNDSLHAVTFLDSEGFVVDVVYVRDGECIDYVPPVASYLSVFAGWRNKETHFKLDITKPVFEDATYESQWIDASIILQNAVNNTGIDLESVDLDALKAFVTIIENAVENADK